MPFTGSLDAMKSQTRTMETGTARNAPKGRKTRKTENPNKDLLPDSLTPKSASEWTPEDGVANDTRPDTAVSSKAVYLAVVQAYIRDAIYNCQTADEDHNPEAARAIYRTEMAIGNLLQRCLDLTPAEMTDFLPDQTKLPWEFRIPEIQAQRTLFFMDHLHRILFRPGEPYPQDTAE